MRSWALLLGGLLVWAAHFFSAYAFASIFPGTDLARWLTLAATAAALLADAAILWLALLSRAAADELDRWWARVSAGGAALSFVAVAWQAFPAII
ncbi:MAG: hypothetical protein H0W39_04210 [Sphingomonas sp.]|nr:hypothetical protein [Sphingomonas sp.]